MEDPQAKTALDNRLTQGECVPGISPNDVLVPVFIGEHIIYVYPPEYYVRFCGRVALTQTESETSHDRTLPNL